MEKVVITPEAYPSFFGAGGDLELCDSQGQTLGYFVRTDDRFAADPAVYEWVQAQISDDELKRRRNEPDGRTTAEVLAGLDSL